jgi:hypothetical protein
LEVAQSQMALFVIPVHYATHALGCAQLYKDVELGLNRDHIRQFCTFLSCSTQPQTEGWIHAHANPKGAKAGQTHPFVKFKAADLEILHAEPEKRQRYTELFVATELPPLRQLVEAITTRVRTRARYNRIRVPQAPNECRGKYQNVKVKRDWSQMHLVKLPSTGDLNTALGSAAGLDWNQVYVSLSNIFTDVRVYAGQAESLQASRPLGFEVTLVPSIGFESEHLN